MITASLAVIAGPNGAMFGQEESTDQEVYSLSPFVVDAGEDTGYRATSTLAGSRLKTNLGDLGSAISVLTEQFFEDVGATDAETALSYALNAEVGGPQGNFIGRPHTNLAGLPVQGSARVFPHFNQRIRGISAATLTRNYFITALPFDTYNTNRVTINRGPNSLLFGIGRAGGVIDNSLSPASRADSFGEFSIRIGERGTYRSTLDYNKSLLNGRLGVRVAGLHEEIDYKQNPAFEKDTRYYIALEGLLFKGGEGILGDTVFKGNFEKGNIDSSRPMTETNEWAIPEWFSVPDPALDGQYGRTFPAWAKDGSFVPKFTVDPLEVDGGISGSVHSPWGRAFPMTLTPGGGSFGGLNDSTIQGVPARAFDVGGFTDESGEPIQRRRFWATNFYIPGTGFARPRITDYNVWDNRKQMLAGKSFLANEDFDAWNTTLEQLLFSGKGGIEISFDKQEYAYHAAGSGNAASQNRIMVDLNERLLDGSPNPNLGRPFMWEHNVQRDTHQREIEGFRATGFYEHDFAENEGLWGRILGNHRVTGFYSEHEQYDANRQPVLGWDGPGVEEASRGQPLSGGPRRVQQALYLGPSLLDPSIQSPSDVRLEGPSSIPIIKAGETYKIQYWDYTDGQFKTGDWTTKEYMWRASTNLEDVESKVLAWQGRFFDNNLVVLYGWRNDSTDRYEQFGNGTDSDGSIRPEQLLLDPDPRLSVDGDTKTKSLVGHLPDAWNPVSNYLKLSIHWNESENFSPGSTRRNALGEQHPPEAGVTEEVGISFSSRDNRISMRLNWFETAQQNTVGIGAGGTDNYFNTAGYGLLGPWVNAEEAGIPFSEAYGNGALGLNTAEAIADGATDPGYSSYDEVYSTILNVMPTGPRELLNLRIENGQVVFDNPQNKNVVGTRDVSAEGFEVDLVGNFTRNWRVGLNIGRQETVFSNAVPVFATVVFETEDNLRESGLYHFFRDLGNSGNTLTNGQHFNNNATARTRDNLAANGQVSREQREWRTNFFTNYTFTEDSLFKGFNIGGAIRYQSGVAIGYPRVANEFGELLPDLSSPFYGPSATNGDVWMGYSKKIRNEKVDWKVQLNVRNAIGSDDPIPIGAQPTGEVYWVRNPNPMDIFLTNTFSF